MSEWISVKDRLPEEGERVLVYQPSLGCPTIDKMLYPNGVPRVFFYKDEDDIWHKSLPNTVTHWCPIPEISEEIHMCSRSNFICQTTQNGLILAHHGKLPTYSQIVVKFCPFCGKESKVN